MSQNPNMLRTMIGIGLTLIFVLGYAVYSNTVESEYYGYETTNTSESQVPNQDDDTVAELSLIHISEPTRLLSIADAVVGV